MQASGERCRNGPPANGKLKWSTGVHDFVNSRKKGTPFYIRRGNRRHQWMPIYRRSGGSHSDCSASGSEIPFALLTDMHGQQIMSTCYSIQITPERPLPAFNCIAEHLWGTGCNVDSDGDCASPEDRQWTELTLSLRGTSGERIDIDLLSLMPLTLVIRSSHPTLCQRAADYIVSVSGGTIGAAVNIETV